MSQHAYADVLLDDQSDAKSHEKELLETGIDLMRQSDKERDHIGKRAEAIHFNTTLWFHLLEDLASPENALPDTLKANLISIGIFITKELAALRDDKTREFTGVIDISQTISEGL